MAESLSDLFLSLLKFAPISRIRRNHGLEHATLHVLAERNPRLMLAGYSDLAGVWILGDVPQEMMESAAREALSRMHNGEHELAIHPNCGTNFATAGLLAGGAAACSMLGSRPRLRDQLDRIPLAILLATLALIISQPLGLLAQKHVTTSGEPEGLEILEIISTKRGRITAHRILTIG